MRQPRVLRAALAVVLGMSLIAALAGCVPVEDDHSLPTDPDSKYGLPLLLGLDPIVRDATLPLDDGAIEQVALLNGQECDPVAPDRKPCEYQIQLAHLPPGLAVGSVLVSSVTPVLPSGILVRVTAVDGLRIEAVEATLSEALEQGEFRVEQEFGPADVVDEFLEEGVTSTTARVAAASGLSRGAVTDAGLDFSYALGHVPIADGVYADGAVGFTVGCGAYAGLTWKKKYGIPLYPNGAYFQASCGVTQDGSIKISGEKSGTFTNTAHIATVTLDTIVTWVGPVPIVLVPKVSIDVSASGELAAGISFGVAEHFGAAIGIKYTDDFHLIHDLSRSFSSQTVTTDKRVSADGGITLGESLFLYGVAGPTMSETLFMNLKSKPPGQKPLWCLRGGLRAEVGLSIDLGITDLDYGPGSVFDQDAELACAGNIPPSISITYPYDGGSVFPGTQHGAPTFFGVALDPEEGPLPITWSSNRDGVLGTTQPSGKLKVDGLSLGEHVITATATDSDGATATATITVIASTAGPGLAFQSKDAYGNWNPISSISGSVGDQVYVRAVTSHTLVGMAPACEQVSWESSLTVWSNGTCDYTIVLTQEGSFPVTGTVTDQDGRTASATMYADVGAAPTFATPHLSSITATRSSPSPQYPLFDGATLSSGDVATLQANYLNHDAAGVDVRYEWAVSTDGGAYYTLLGNDSQPESGTSRQFNAPTQYKVHIVYDFRLVMVNKATNAPIETRTFTLEYQGDPG